MPCYYRDRQTEMEKVGMEVEQDGLAGQGRKPESNQGGVVGTWEEVTYRQKEVDKQE